jgi:hypothetical protein
MFFVSGTKIYLTEFNTTSKVYPEVKLIKTSDGTVQMKVQSSGISKKPVNSQVCTAREVIAQFGSGATASRVSSDK